MQKMQDAASAGSQYRDPRTSGYYRQMALGALNGALKESQQACSSCQSACNKPNPNSMCNSAGQMASKQQQLNKQTQDMLGNTNPGSLSMGEQASMQRLAVEQRELQKSAQQLSQEAAASQQSLGRLDDVAKEMEEVAKDLENRNVTDRTTEKQEHIESRLLDFQRAQREKEFSPQRQSRTGVDLVRTSPGQLPNHPGVDQLHEDLLRALDANYTPDYEQLIRQYFDALSKWK
jgi:capsule polysaccharide export protein KpsE/RkpR